MLTEILCLSFMSYLCFRKADPGMGDPSPVPAALAETNQIQKFSWMNMTEWGRQSGFTEGKLSLIYSVFNTLPEEWM